MPEDCLVQRSEPLIAAASRERHQVLARRLLEIAGEMNGRGLLHSSVYVLSVGEACASELHERASIAWTCIQRAHESCGGGTADGICPYFERVLRLESDKVDSAFQSAVGAIAASLMNKSMLSLAAVREAQAHLLEKYRGEIDIYVGNLRRRDGTHLEEWKNRFKNNRFIAFASLVATGIVVIAALTDGLSKLLSFFWRLLGEA
jgi:hypothetical protein